MKKFFKYLRPLWEGDDRKISLKSLASLGLIVDFIVNVHNSASIAIRVLNLILRDKQVDPATVAAMGTNLAQIAIILGVEAALIAALLGLKTYQSTVIATATTPPPCPAPSEEGA